MFTTFILFATANPASIFDASLAAHARVRRMDVSISIETKVNKDDVVSSARLQFIRPDRLQLTVQEPQQKGQAASNRTYDLSGNTFTALDLAAGEYAQRNFPFPSQLGLADRLTAALGNPGDAVGVILSDRLLTAFLSNYRNLRDFKQSMKPGAIELRRTYRNTSAIFDFGSSDHLLRLVRLQGPGSRLVWNFHYNGEALTLATPKTRALRKVESLTARAAPPRYLSPEARSLATRSERAYANLRSTVCRYLGPDGSGTFWVRDGSYRQDQGQNSWSYSSRQLTARIGDVTYSGNLRQSKIAAALNRVGGSVQTMVLQMLQGRNPMGTLLVPESTVRLAGQLVTEGAPCGILEIKSKGITLSVIVRKSDGMILSTRSAILGRRGEVALREETTYRYDSVNRGVGGQLLSVSAAGARPFPR